MDKFLLDEYRKQFTFLSELISDDADASAIDGISVVKADEEFYSRTPYCSGATGSRVGIDRGERIHFTADGITLIKNAVKPQVDITHNEAYMDNTSRTGETVLEALERYKDKSIRFAVLEHYGYEVVDHYSIGGKEYTIYVMKAAALSELREKKQTEAKEKVVQAINEVERSMSE